MALGSIIVIGVVILVTACFTNAHTIQDLLVSVNVQHNDGSSSVEVFRMKENDPYYETRVLKYCEHYHLNDSVCSQLLDDVESALPVDKYLETNKAFKTPYEDDHHTDFNQHLIETKVENFIKDVDMTSTYSLTNGFCVIYVDSASELIYLDEGIRVAQELVELNIIDYIYIICRSSVNISEFDDNLNVLIYRLESGDNGGETYYVIGEIIEEFRSRQPNTDESTAFNPSILFWDLRSISESGNYLVVRDFLEKSSSSIHLLKSGMYDVVGIEYLSHSPCRHMLWNIWWATGKYIRSRALLTFKLRDSVQCWLLRQQSARIYRRGVGSSVTDIDIPSEEYSDDCKGFFIAE